MKPSKWGIYFSAETHKRIKYQFKKILEDLIEEAKTDPSFSFSELIELIEEAIKRTCTVYNRFITEILFETFDDEENFNKPSNKKGGQYGRKRKDSKITQKNSLSNCSSKD